MRRWWQLSSRTRVVIGLAGLFAGLWLLIAIAIVATVVAADFGK